MWLLFFVYIIDEPEKTLFFENKGVMKLQRHLVSPSSEDLTLGCKAKGEQPIRYKWYKNNKLLLTRRVDSGLETDKPFLKLKDLVPSDSATYTCVAENSEARISFNFSLNVQGKLTVKLSIEFSNELNVWRKKVFVETSNE